MLFTLLPLLQVFAYNAEKDRLDLCLGQRHIQVQPLDKETLLLAHTRPTQIPAEEKSSGSLSSEASFSGAIGHRDTSHARMAFSGKGQTLAGAPSPPKPTVEVRRKCSTYFLGSRNKNILWGRCHLNPYPPVEREFLSRDSNVVI